MWANSEGENMRKSHFETGWQRNKVNLILDNGELDALRDIFIRMQTELTNETSSKATLVKYVLEQIQKQIDER